MAIPYRAKLAAVADPQHEAALAALARLATVTGDGHPASVRTTAIFGRGPARLSLPLNRKTTRQAITTIPLTTLEPRQELVPVQGLAAYIVRPRRDPADVVHVVMRDGRDRYLVQEGHTRLGAAVLRGDTAYPVRLWEFQETAAGTFEPVMRGRHQIGTRIRNRLVSMRDEDGFVPFSDGRTTALIQTVHDVLASAGHVIAADHPRHGAVVDYWRDFAHDEIPTWRTYVTHAGPGRAPAIAQYADTLRKVGWHVDVAPLNPTHATTDVVWIEPTRPVDVVSLPDIRDVSFPALIGAIPAKPPRKKKRKRVQYQGVSLSRAPMKFEVQVLSLADIPPRLDAAVAELQQPQASVYGTLSDLARFGSMQALQELVRQGAPATILTTPPDCDRAVRVLAADVAEARQQDLARAEYDVTMRCSLRRISARRRDALVRELTAVRTPGILKRHAAWGVNRAFALGRAAVVAQYRRPREPLHLAKSKADQWEDGDIWVDAVIQTAVMDTNTCEECEAVDGEVMELGDDRQEELHPPYVKCLGSDRCRCVQIALLSDGSEIDVDEVPDAAYDTEDF